MSRRHAKGRNIHGILLFDKPHGASSNAALQTVKRLYQARKAGHTGSLDPLATGLLPLCFGDATKVSAFLLDADKSYRTECRLGVTTTTGDAEGEILQEKPLQGLNERHIKHVLQQFIGDIEQIPPMYSALKHQGQRLYQLARRGEVVERAPRQVKIYRINLLTWEQARLEIEVDCSKGTYIRTLVEDIGEALGCGAHTSALSRTAVGPYRLSDAMDLTGLQALATEQDYTDLDARLLSADSALGAWPAVILKSDLSDYICQGQAVLVPKAPTKGLLRLYREAPRGCQFMGVGQVLDDGRIGLKRLICS